jgi:hypothetical protein
MSKRGNNEGSIYQRRSDCKWCAAVTLVWQRGSRLRCTKDSSASCQRAPSAWKGYRDSHSRRSGTDPWQT